MSKSLNKNTREVQSALAQYCRDGVLQEIEGTRPERLKHYRRLVKNVVFDALRSAYPITRRVLGEDVFDELIQDFFSNGSPQNPQYWKMPGELIAYCEEHNHQLKLDKPYLINLLQFEWWEIEVHTAPDKEIPDALDQDDPMVLVPVINPDHMLAYFEYPVFKRLDPKVRPAKGHYFLLIHRLKDNGEVRFMELSPTMAVLVELLSTGTLTGQDLLHKTANTLGVQAIDNGPDMLNVLIEKNVIIGCINQNS